LERLADSGNELRNVLIKMYGSCFIYFLSFYPSYILLLGASAKFQKATISFVMSVCPSVHPSTWNNSASTGQI